MIAREEAFVLQKQCIKRIQKNLMECFMKHESAGHHKICDAPLFCYILIILRTDPPVRPSDRTQPEFLPDAPA